MSSPWHNRVRDLTLSLVKFPSVTNTAGEQAFAAHLHIILGAHQYFQANPELLRLELLEGDPGRANVFALVRGHGTSTVVLAGHYDVVSGGNYGALASLAFDPESLLPQLIAVLEKEQRDAASVNCSPRYTSLAGKHTPAIPLMALTQIFWRRW